MAQWVFEFPSFQGGVFLSTVSFQEDDFGDNIKFIINIKIDDLWGHLSQFMGFGTSFIICHLVRIEKVRMDAL